MEHGTEWSVASYMHKDVRKLIVVKQLFQVTNSSARVGRKTLHLASNQVRHKSDRGHLISFQDTR